MTFQWISESQKGLDWCTTSPKRLKESAQTTIPSKESVIIEKERKLFHDKHKFMEFVFTNPAVQRPPEGKHQSKEIVNYIEEGAIKK